MTDPNRPGEDEEEDGDAQVGRGGVDPDVQRERRQEREQIWRFLLRLLVENADSEVHEGHGEVHGLLPLVGDGEVGNGQVGFLKVERLVPVLEFNLNTWASSSPIRPFHSPVSLFMNP